MAVDVFAYTVVTPKFLQGDSWNTSEVWETQLAEPSNRTMDWMLQTWHGLDLQSTIRTMQVDSGNIDHYTRIENLDCLLTYNNLLGNRSDFIMVSSAAPMSNNSLLLFGMSGSQTWDIGYSLCEGGSEFDCGRLADLTPARQAQTIEGWHLGNYTIDYCLSSQKSTRNSCSVEYSFSVTLSQSDSVQSRNL